MFLGFKPEFSQDMAIVELKGRAGLANWANAWVEGQG